MPRKKKETLPHLDLETVSEEMKTKKSQNNDENKNTSLGAVLKNAREKKKLSLAQIASKLCIKEIYLDALEKGHYYVFPGLAYGVGFLRTYAQFLELDSKELVEKFHEETSEIKVEPIEMPIPKNANLMPSFRTIFKSLLILLIFYLIWYIYISLTRPIYVPVGSQETPLNVSEAEILPTEENEVAMDALEQSEPVEADHKTDEPELAAVPVEEAPIIADTVRMDPKPITMKKSSFKERLLRKFTPSKIYGVKKSEGLSIVATEEVWVEIEDGNNVVLETVLYPGDRYNVPQNDNLFLNTANAGALTVYVHDKKRSPLGRKGELVEGVSLTVENFN